MQTYIKISLTKKGSFSDYQKENMCGEGKGLLYWRKIQSSSRLCLMLP